ncbi:Homeobox-leucine zipper protein hox32 [Asimina triloba]
MGFCHAHVHAVSAHLQFEIPDVGWCGIGVAGFAYLPAGVCVSSMGRPVSYEQAIAWKVLNEEDSHHCLAFMFINWSFL